MPVKFFTLGGDKSKIKPITDVKNLVFEDELKREINIENSELDIVFAPRKQNAGRRLGKS